jgi:hypothetical protein
MLDADLVTLDRKLSAALEERTVDCPHHMRALVTSLLLLGILTPSQKSTDTPEAGDPRARQGDVRQ